MNKFLQVLYAFFSAIFTSLAIQNDFFIDGSPFLGLFALVPLYFALSQTQSFHFAGVLTGIQLMFVHLFSSFWLGYFRDFAIFTLGATTVYYAILGYCIGYFLYTPFYSTRKNQLAERAFLKPFYVPLRIFFFATLWTIYEWYKSIGFLAYPWGTLIMSAWKWQSLTQIVAITGTWGISFLYSLFSALIAEGLYLIRNFQIKQDSYKNVALFCISLFVLSVGYGQYERQKKRIPVKTMNIVLVQPNVNYWEFTDDTEIILKSQELTKNVLDKNQSEKDKKNPDLVLWSESILAYPYPYSHEVYEHHPWENPLLHFIKTCNVPFIIGAPVEVSSKFSFKRDFNNAAIYIDKNGDYQGFYGKVQLVPFAERIPYSETAFVQKWMQKLVGFSDGWVPGNKYTLFPVPLPDNKTVHISTPICFEDAFPYICRNLFFLGSEAFLNITNDAWSLTNSAEIQHFVIASFRAQEFRTTLVRSTNAGLTSVVDPTGNILYRMPLFQSDSDMVIVPIFAREITPYALLGDWLPIGLLIFSFIACIIVVYKQKNKE